MTVRLIKTEDDYNKALQRLEEIFDAKPQTKEGDELEILGLLIDIYEKEHFSVEIPDPIEAIKFRMEQMQYRQKDLATIIGMKSHASEIINRKRKLSLSMIRQLHVRLRIPADVLIQAY